MEDVNQGGDPSFSEAVMADMDWYRCSGRAPCQAPNGRLKS